MDIRLEGVEFRRDGFTLTADLSVASGRIVAVLGPSGSGKSTLLNLVAGFETSGRGRVRLGGTDMTGTSPGARPVTVVFQDNNLFPHLTVARNVGLGADPRLRLDAAAREEMRKVLADVGLTGMEARRPAELSGGQQSRAALARALLRDRPILLLDEAFAALGPALRREMLGLVDRLARAHGMTVMMVTHDPEDARAVADDVLFIAEGQAAAPAPTARLFADPPEALRTYLGS